MSFMEKNNRKDARNESGNVLFLILIAVALFAALSYAVTQSSRSGVGDASNETNLISSAQVTQYPASIRTSVIRMVVSNNVDVATLNFDTPSNFATTCNASPSRCVFHPSGGGAAYVGAPADIMENNAAGQWYFSGHYEVTNLGISTASNAAGNDIIAFLPGVKSSICSKINSELGIGGDTIHSTNLDPAAAAQFMGTAYTIPASEINIGTAGGAAAFDGQPFGCIEDSGGDYIYYHVIVER